MRIRVRIKKIESNMEKDIDINKFPKINIKYLEERLEENKGEVDFEFKADYENNNYIKMVGTAFIEERKNKENKLNKEELTELTNAINYICGINGVLIAKIFGIRSPLIPPRIGLK